MLPVRSRCTRTVASGSAGRPLPRSVIRLAPLRPSLSLPAPSSRSFRTSTVPRSGSKSFRHYELPENNEGTPFEFSPENTVEVKKLLAKYPEGYKQGALLPLLDLAQRQNDGWLSLNAMHKVAKIIGCTNMDVYQVATFYTMYNRDPIGKHHVQVCTTTPCMLRNAYDVLDTCKKHLGIEVGETTKDKKFTLAEVECLGACVNAPMMQINDEFYEDLTPETTKRVLDDLAAGKQPKPGPQNGRRAAEGPQGKTTLLGEVPGPGYGFRTDI